MNHLSSVHWNKTARLDAAFVGGEITIARSVNFFTVFAVVSDQLDITAAGQRPPAALAARRDRALPITKTLADFLIRQIGPQCELQPQRGGKKNPAGRGERNPGGERGTPRGGR